MKENTAPTTLNTDRLMRDAASLFRAGWTDEQIARHFVRNNLGGVYGANLRYAEIKPMLTAWVVAENAANRAANRAARQEIGQLFMEVLRRHFPASF